MPLSVSQATTSRNEYGFCGPGVLGTMVHPAKPAVISEKRGFWEALQMARGVSVTAVKKLTSPLYRNICLIWNEGSGYEGLRL